MNVRAAMRSAVRSGVRLATGGKARDEPNTPPTPEWTEIAPLYVAFADRFDTAINSVWPAH